MDSYNLNMRILIKLYKRIVLILLFFPLLFACDKANKKESIKYKPTITNAFGMTLNYIKPGTFLMGPDYKLNYSGREDEVPHKVTLTKGFYVQTTETTVGQWKQFIKATNYITHAEKYGYSWYCGGYRYSSEKNKGIAGRTLVINIMITSL